MANLITALINKYQHRGPILVIGGGPSVTEDLARLPRGFIPACVISANGHGFKQDRFKVDYIVCMDHRHSETKEFMQDLLSPHGVPIITRHWWGDYRIPTRPIQFRLNSGFTSIVMGVLMGGSQVVVTGLDCYRGDTYFHDKRARTCQSDAAWPRFRRQIARLDRAAKGANIRPMSGPLVVFYPNYRPDELFVFSKDPPFIKEFVNMREYQARATTAFHWTFADLPAGATFPVSETEGKHMLYNNKRYPIEVAGLDT